MTVWFDSLVSMLAFLPVSDVIDGFVELTDNDLPQELVSYFKTYWPLQKKEAKGPQRHTMELIYFHRTWEYLSTDM